MKYFYYLYETYPSQITLLELGHTVQNRSIMALRIKGPEKSDHEKQIIFVTSLTYGNDWVSLVSTLHLTYQLIERAQDNIDLLENFEWIIVPMMNPDGLAYTVEEDRFFKNNRNPEYNKICPGVDIGQNFPFLWEYRVN